jgi:hypothetical protein
MLCELRAAKMAKFQVDFVLHSFTVVTNFTTFYTDQVFKASSATVPENQIDL